MKPLYKLNPLPESLGEAFLIAVKEADALYQNEKQYYPASGRWHLPAYPEDGEGHPEEMRCLTCLAGALMAAGTGLEPKMESTPFFSQGENGDPCHFSFADRNRLIAIDLLREGRFEKACREWHGKPLTQNTLSTLLKQTDARPIEWNGLDEWNKVKPKLMKRGEEWRNRGL